MGDLVSIIVPIYNVEKYLRQCLDSLVAQTYQNLDIILVDDGSTDQSGGICDEYGRKDVRIRVVHKKNEGVMLARKNALHMAIGKYCVCVDGDDWLEADAVEVLMDYREKYDADVIIGNYCKVKGEKKCLHCNSVEPGIYSKEKLYDEIYTKMLYDSRTHDFGIKPEIWGNLYQTKSLIMMMDAVPDEITYGDDVSTIYFLLFQSQSVGIIENSIYNYVINPNGISKAYHANQTRNTIILLNYMYQQIKTISDSGFKKQLNNYAIRIMNANFSNEARSGFKNYRISMRRLEQFIESVGMKEIIKQKQFYELSSKSKITTWVVVHGLSWILLFIMELKNVIR